MKTVEAGPAGSVEPCADVVDQNHNYSTDAAAAGLLCTSSVCGSGPSKGRLIQAAVYGLLVLPPSWRLTILKVLNHR
jgi:hypothetical protein